jgi:hypothetical protein
MDFSRAEAMLTASKGNATSMSFFFIFPFVFTKRCAQRHQQGYEGPRSLRKGPKAYAKF